MIDFEAMKTSFIHKTAIYDFGVHEKYNKVSRIASMIEENFFHSRWEIQHSMDRKHL